MSVEHSGSPRKKEKITQKTMQEEKKKSEKRKQEKQAKQEAKKVFVAGKRAGLE